MSVRIYPIFTSGDVVNPQHFLSRRLVDMPLSGIPLLVFGRFVDGDIDFSPFRKSNSTRPDPAWKRFLQHHYRKIVETSASLVERLLPKHIHATNSAGFELKVILFVLALSFDRLLKVAT